MKTIPWIILTILLMLALTWRECTRPVKYIIEHEHTSDTIYGDTVLIPFPVVKIKMVDSIVYVVAPADIDTGAILAAYFEEKYYRQYPVADDSNVFVAFDAMVSENQLRWVKPYIKIKKPTVINHYTTNLIQEKSYQKSFNFKAGGFGINYPGGYDIGASIGFRYKKLYFEYGRGIGETNLLSISFDL